MAGDRPQSDRAEQDLIEACRLFASVGFDRDAARCRWARGYLLRTAGPARRSARGTDVGPRPAGGDRLGGRRRGGDPRTGRGPAATGRARRSGFARLGRSGRCWPATWSPWARRRACWARSRSLAATFPRRPPPARGGGHPDPGVPARRGGLDVPAPRRRPPTTWSSRRSDRGLPAWPRLRRRPRHLTGRPVPRESARVPRHAVGHVPSFVVLHVELACLGREPCHRGVRRTCGRGGPGWEVSYQSG